MPVEQKKLGGGSLACGVPAELLRLQYAMAIVRLVNGIADSTQKGRTALSVANLAEDAGTACICYEAVIKYVHL